jgi:hypothetical protein
MSPLKKMKRRHDLDVRFQVMDQSGDYPLIGYLKLLHVDTAMFGSAH